ncbi:MAG: pyridoxamine 5'-phosphate oxidase family protein [Acidimicrobiaceae bacterium]|nr:pyridoxamine 5'-phosphate oxidase family protein [Acidimicrobiaceae bacterium]
MPSWSEFAAAAPEFAARVGGLFTTYRHHTMATLRRDGSPRISGTELEFEDGELRLGMMAGTRRADDLRRDPRIAIHSHSVEPPEVDGEIWAGEAKLSGRAIALAGDGDEVDRFRIDIAEVVLTGWGTPADHLLIERWRAGDGLTRFERR